MHTPAMLGLALSLAALGACGGSADSPDSAPAARESAVPPIDPQRVPSDLRHLVPLAQEWGIGDDVDRLAKVDNATRSQRAELRRALAPHQARITQWLDSFGEAPLPQEAARFMYMQLAVDEMTGLP